MARSSNNTRHVKSFKVDPKLRMFANGSQEVNEIRSEFQGGVAVKGALKEEPMRELNLTHMPKITSALKKKKKTKEPPEKILTNIFVRLTPEKGDTIVPGKIVTKGTLVSARVPLTKLNDIQSMAGVISVEASQALRSPQPKVNNRYATKATSNILHNFRTSHTKKSQVIIGIIDVGGFDFAHPDFLDSKGQTRFCKIWDQGGDFRQPPSRFGYGSEFTQTQLNKAIKDSKAVKVPPHYIEKQSQLTVGSHGTHVASIAAGKSGVCPDAILAGVLIALKDSDLDRRKSFYDSSCVVHALEYLTDIAVERGLPISINISLGTNGHAHDGSDAASRWIDNELLLPGRAVTVAAGNAGQDSPLASDDLGFVMGRIHTSGRIKAQGLTEDIQWCVIGNGFTDVSENELEIWYPCQDRFSIRVKPPGQGWTREVHANEFIENMQLSDGSFISIYNDLYHPTNGLNCLSVYLSPNFNANQIVPIKSGIWQVRIKGEEVRNGEYHAWIERDDPRPLGPIGEQRDLWNFPSFFSQLSNVDDTSISSLACARNVISVGNLDLAIEKVNVTSSQGPTRDKRTKPEVIAPGTNITAAKGFAGPDELWISMTGTSMAAPIVCGVAAQMLEVEPQLTSAQIQGIMVRTSTPLPGTDYEWKNDSGFGVISPQSCVDEAKGIFKKTDLKP